MLLIHGPVMEAGSFPWGLLIIAGLIYFLWNKSGGRPWGRGFDNHQMHSGPQALFDQWHREAHQAAAQPQGSQPYAAQAQPQASFAPAAPTATTSADASGAAPTPQPPQPPTAGSPGPTLERW